MVLEELVPGGRAPHLVVVKEVLPRGGHLAHPSELVLALPQLADLEGDLRLGGV